MTKRLVFLLLIAACTTMLFPYIAHAQYGNVWAFGDSAGIDFNRNPPVSVKTHISTSEGSASMCDADGNLLFYTDGYSVWDRNNKLMPAGTDLTRLGRNITASTAQGALIIPVPGNAQQYYVFSLGALESGSSGRLYYSIIDMSLNNGLGNVLPDSKGKLLSVNNTEQMMAVSGDNCNIWLMTASRLPSVFKAYKVDYLGIDTVPIISARIAGGGAYSGIIGTMDVSPDRNKLVMAQGNLVLYDFSPASGKIDNGSLLSKGGLSSYYGVAFSPDNSKLYASAIDDSLYQFDLSSKDTVKIVASRTALGTAWAIKRGPDGKVYCATYTKYLSVVHQPNLAGKACQYDPTGFELADGASSILGLPNSATIVVNKKNYTSIKDTVPCADNFLLQPQNPNGFNYRWEDGASGPGHLINASGTYWVTYQAAAGKCEEYVDTFHVVFFPIVRVYSTTAFAGRCRADTFTMRALTFANQYAWEDGSTGRERRINRSGTYWVTYRIDSLCQQYADTFIAVYPEKDYEVSFVVDTLACAKDWITFQNTSNDHFDHFQWTFGDQDTANTKSPVHAYSRAGVYPVTLIGQIGGICPDTVLHFITIDSVYPIRFRSDRNSICTGESITFYPQTDFSTNSLHWEFGDDSAIPEENGPEFRHAYAHAGIFPVKLRAINRVCPDAVFTDTISVYAIPEIDLGPDTALCLDEKPLILKNLLPQPQGEHHYLWSNGDTTASLKVLSPGTYSLTIKLEPTGCSNTEIVEVTKKCYIDIPNAFTPDGDGNNDFFFPRQFLSRNITRFWMQIWDRWGKVVFASVATNGRGWDGRCDEKEQPTGVYVYAIDIEVDGHAENYKGNVTLLR